VPENNNTRTLCCQIDYTLPPGIENELFLNIIFIIQNLCEVSTNDY